MGRYVRVWIYEDNEKFIDHVDNVGKTINNALSAYSSSMRGSVSPDVSVGSLQGTPMVSQANKVTCRQGHMLINGTNQCISKACKYGGLR